MSVKDKISFADFTGTLDSKQFSIIIPAFNEGQSIGPILEEISSISHFIGSEVIVVDDGSTDDTASILDLFSWIKLVQHRVNRGYGAALVSGMKRATREFIIWVDSDGQHRLEDLVAIMLTMVRHNPDYCIGVRNTSSYQETSRKTGKWILRKVVRIAAGRPVADFNSGLRGFRRSVIVKYLHLLPKGFGASTTTTLVMLEQGYQGIEIPITVLPRIGKSSVKQFRDGLRTMTLILRIFLLFKPLHFFGSIGGIMTFVGMGYGLRIAYTQGQGFPVLGAIIFLAGVQTVFLGLVMDQIAAMRRERFE